MTAHPLSPLAVLDEVDPLPPLRPSRRLLGIAACLALAGGVATSVLSRWAWDDLGADRAAAVWYGDEGAGIAWLVGASDGAAPWECALGAGQLTCEHIGLSRYGTVREPGPIDEARARSGLGFAEGLVVQFDPERWSCSAPEPGDRPNLVSLSCARV